MGRGTLVQVVDGGRGGAVRVARQLTQLTEYAHVVVLSGQWSAAWEGSDRVTVLNAPPEARRFVPWLASLLRRTADRSMVLAHRDWARSSLACIATRTRLACVSHGASAHPETGWRDRVHRVALRAHPVIAVGADVADVLRNRYGVRSVVANNGVPIYPTCPPSPMPPLRLVYCARLERVQKRPDVAIHVVARLRQAGVDARLSMVGDGPAKADLMELAASLGLAEAVRFTGWVSNPIDHIREANVLIHSSRWEGNSLTIMDALMLGRPVVASSVAGIRMHEGAVGLHLVSPGDDVAGFVTHLRRLAMLSGEEAPRASEVIRAHAIEAFSEAHMLSQWSAVLAGLATPRPRTG